MTQLRIAVVGAGAAGITAAIRAAEGGAQVTLLNAHPHVGLKILMSGGTRCNVTHRVVSERDFNGGSRPFVARVLRAFKVEQTLEWFAEMGVELKLEETGKYFPVSDDAQSVLDALMARVTSAGVTLEAGARVIRVEAVSGATAATAGGASGAGSAVATSAVAKSGAAPFRIGVEAIADTMALGVTGVARAGQLEWPLAPRTPERWIDCDRVILATGGLSFPRTGSDGTGYALALALGHTLEPPIPALTPLAAEDPWCAELQGLTAEVTLRLLVSGKPEAEVRGSLLFAHFGYTGPAALDLSRHWLRAGESGGERRVVASFIPGAREETLLNAWIEMAPHEPRATVRSMLAGQLPDRLITIICREAEVDASKMLSQISRAGRVRLAQHIVSHPLPVSGVLGYEKAEVTAGGVKLAEVNPSTLESRVVPGLYLCGEVLDVEGRLGGFNFQWSWSSGTVAGRAEAKG